MNKNNQQTNEIKLSREFAERIKKRWEELAERQKSSGHPLHSGRKITEVSFVKDHHGKTAVQIGLRNGRSIRDNGQEKVLINSKNKTARLISGCAFPNF